MVEAVELQGGWENVGAVWRVGDEVRRPASDATSTLQAFARHLRASGFMQAPEPLGVDGEGRERWVFIEGYVPSSDFPSWVCARSTLSTVALMLRRFHDAGRGFVADQDRWNREMASADGGPVVGHNDVCPENVVFLDREPVGLIDFDLAARTDPLLDLATLARLWSPLEDGSYTSEAAIARVATAVRAYGQGDVDPDLFHRAVLESHTLGTRFMTRRIARNQEPFITFWRASGGYQERSRRFTWWLDHRSDLITALSRSSPGP